MVTTTPIALNRPDPAKPINYVGQLKRRRWARKGSSGAKVDSVGPSESDIRDAGNPRKSCVEAGKKATEPSAKTDEKDCEQLPREHQAGHQRRGSQAARIEAAELHPVVREFDVGGPLDVASPIGPIQ
jgi:hypothetical protein